MMKSILLLIFACNAFANTIVRNGNRAVALPGMFPFQVSQVIDGEHYCGGSIIDPVTVLSAGHCINDFPSSRMKIIAGTNQLDGNGKSYGVSSYVLHENFNPDSLVNDIAVFKLSSSIVYTTNINSISLDSNAITTAVSTVITGWGFDSSSGSPNDLQYFKGKVVDWNSCKAAAADEPYDFQESHICALTSYNGVQDCNSDTGNPLMYNNKQIGIASWGTSCTAGVPDVYTRISSFIKWIENQMG